MAQTPASPNRIGGLTAIGLTTFESGVTATASGTQATAYQLTAQVNQISVCATANDSVALPKINIVKNNPGFLGFVCVVQNAGAAALRVFGGTGVLDTINGIATGTGIVIPPGGTGIFVASTYVPSTDVGNWVGAISDTFDSVSITGGTIDGTTIGGISPAAGTFSAMTVVGTAIVGGSTTSLVGFYGGTAVARAASISPVLGTGRATALVGFATSAQFDAWQTSINAIITALQNIHITA